MGQTTTYSSFEVYTQETKPEYYDSVARIISTLTNTLLYPTLSLARFILYSLWIKTPQNQHWLASCGGGTLQMPDVGQRSKIVVLHLSSTPR